LQKNKLIFQTFGEWSRAGFKIIKGSKSLKRNNKNEPLFSGSQVIYTKEDDIGMDEFDADEYNDDPFNDPYLFC
jgi:hypothetical protein